MPSITVHSVTLTRSALEALDGHGYRLAIILSAIFYGDSFGHAGAWMTSVKQ